MVDTAEFERDLLARIVQNIKPSKAAIFSGQNYQMSVSHGVQTDQAELNMELVEKVVQTEGPVSDKVHKRQLAVPYKNAEGKVLGVMYVEIAAPRRLKFRDLAILQGLGRQMVERHWQPSRGTESSLNPETMGEVTRYVRSTLSIVSSVLKPQRVLIIVRLEEGPRIVASRGFDDIQDLSAVPFSRELVDSIWEKGETCHIRDALNDPQYSKFAGVREYSLRSVCICPLNKLDGEDRGLIYLDSCKDPAEFLTAEVSILQRLALALEKDLARVLAPEPEMGAGDLLGGSSSSALDNDHEYSLPEASSYLDEPDSFVVHAAAEEPSEAEPVPDDFEASDLFEDENGDSETDSAEDEAGELTEATEETQEFVARTEESVGEPAGEFAGGSVEEDPEAGEPAEMAETVDTQAPEPTEAADELEAESEEAVVEAGQAAQDPPGATEESREDKEAKESDDRSEAPELAPEAEKAAAPIEDADVDEPLDEADERADVGLDEESEQTFEDGESVLQGSENEEESEVEYDYDSEEPESEPTVEQAGESSPPPLLDLYDGSPVERGAEYQYEPSDNDLVTVTLPPEILDGPDEDDSEDQIDSDEIEPTVEDTAPTLQIEKDSEVESVRALPVDATVEVSAEIAARALAGVRAMQKQQAAEDSEPADEGAEPHLDPLDAEFEQANEADQPDPDLEKESEATVEYDGEEPDEAGHEEESTPEDRAVSHVGKSEDEYEEVDKAAESDADYQDDGESEKDEAGAGDREDSHDRDMDEDQGPEHESEQATAEAEEESALKDDAVSHVGESEDENSEESELEDQSLSHVGKLDTESEEVDQAEESDDDVDDEQPEAEHESEQATAEAEEESALKDDAVSHVGESEDENSEEFELEDQSVSHVGKLDTVSQEVDQAEESDDDADDEQPEAEHESEQATAEAEEESALEDDAVSHVGESEDENSEESELEDQSVSHVGKLDTVSEEVDQAEESDDDADEQESEERASEAEEADEGEPKADEKELENPQVAAPLAARSAATAPAKPPAEVAEQEESLMKYVERGLQAVTPAKNASFLERLKWVFSPKSVPQGGDYSHIHIAGKVVLQDDDWKGDEPIEVTLRFPSHKMTVILEIAKGESDYAYHGRFEGESPVWFEVTVEKPGYFPIKLSKVTFQAGDVDARGEPSTRVHEITLIPRND